MSLKVSKQEIIYSTRYTGRPAVVRHVKAILVYCSPESLRDKCLIGLAVTETGCDDRLPESGNNTLLNDTFFPKPVSLLSVGVF